MEPVYFVHISDTHFGPTADYVRHGRAPLPYARLLVKTINELPFRPDFVVHTGDVTTHPDDDAYALAAETLSALQVPVYYVTGNHDTAADIRRFLRMGPHDSNSPDELSYTFECRGFRFLALDARGPDSIDPHGWLPAEQLEIVRREATPEGPPLVIFVHFPALALNSPWMDANMPILNGESLHQALLPARDRIRGVFHGHVHHARQTLRDGILYVAVASSFAQFTSWPNEEKVNPDDEALPGYNFVQLLPDQTIVQQRTFARLPEGAL